MTRGRKKSSPAVETDRVPHNPEAERAVLGAILLDNQSFQAAAELLQPADFFLAGHRRIFARMTQLSEESRAIDLITLHEELDRAGELEAAGGSAYLSSLVDGVPRVSNVEHYARIVREKAARREALHALDELQTSVSDETQSLTEALRQGVSELSRLERLRLRSPGGSGGANGSGLLREVEAFISRFVVLPVKAGLPVALWAMATHVFEEFDPFPYLAVCGPTKRCGKTRLLQVLELLVGSPVRAAGISEAALFRLVDAQRPTLLLDEADTLRGKGERAEALRQLLNAGHGRGARVYRCAGQGHELQAFEVFAPKALACIGLLPDTVADRSILIPMQRKSAAESAERFSFRKVSPEGEALRARISGWTEAHRGEIAEAYESLRVPWLEDDRAAENFEPLFAGLFVAELRRLQELRDCVLALAAGKTRLEQDESLPLRLLADIRQVWEPGQPAMFSSELLHRLRGIEDAPWAADFTLSARKLARWLRGFGVEPRNVRIGTGQAKGYSREELEDAFLRYLALNPSQASQASVYGASGEISHPSQTVPGTDTKSAQNPLFMGPGTLGTDKRPPGEG